MKFNSKNIKNGLLILSWALYDLANQFFALNIVSLYFVRWLTLERQAPEILYSIAFGISTFFIAVSAPILGAISDITGRRRIFLIYLTLLSTIFTMILGAYKSIFLGLLFFVIANFGCQTATVFYNALIVNITPERRVGLVSGFGKMMSYSGAIVALYLVKPIVLKSGYQATFLPTGFLFLIFSLPCMLFIKDEHPAKELSLSYFLKKDKLLEIFKTLKTTAFDTYNFPGLLDFLKSSFFGLCAVNTVILFMSVYATRAFGLNETEVINLVTLSTFFAIAGSLFSGFISDYIGHKRCLAGVFLLWGACFIAGAFVRNIHWYRVIGALSGIALGSTWVVSRAVAVSIVPAERVGEIFGLFNLVGYLSAIIGALFWGGMVFFLSHLGEWGYRITLLSLTLFIIPGLIFLLRIPDVSSRNNNKIILWHRKV
ncbi:MAG: MFS transporter [Candidatus Omnitrophota bacterium]|nr:MFS transporter [Candidatus Omnitrophota bacterium]